ncbi:MAG: energy transducer TonB [Flavobacteriia bacterium]|jgi:protein TonB
MKGILLLVFIVCVNFSFSQEEIFIDCYEEAKFPGDMNHWIIENIQIPAEVSECSLNVRVYLKFVVEVDGSLTNISVVKGSTECEACNVEAKRLIASMPKWKPGKNCKGEIERVWCQMPINFK